MTISLALVVLLAFLIESSLGFGSALVTVALGSLFMPMDLLLPAYLPPALLLSSYLSIRYYQWADKRLLFGLVMPCMVLGLPLGLFAFRALPASTLKRCFGAFIAGLAMIELWWARGDAAATTRAPPMNRLLAALLLVLGGVAHGAFSTGGPLAVYVTGRTLGDDKAKFRATLSVLWLLLNAVMVVSYLALGNIHKGTLKVSLALIPALAMGLYLGELLHARVPMRTFKLAVFALLLAAGATLVARG